MVAWRKIGKANGQEIPSPFIHAEALELKLAEAERQRDESKQSLSALTHGRNDMG